MKLSRILPACLLGGLMAVTAVAGEADWAKSYQLESQGKIQDALTTLDSLGKDDDDHLQWLRKGWLNYQLGRHDESLKAYTTAAARYPRSVEALLGETLPLLATRRWKEAETQARKALELAPWNYTAAIRLMAALEAQKDWKALAKVGVDMAERFPSDATILVYLARAQNALGWKNEAAISWQGVLNRVPGHIEAKKALGRP
ncbi:tetratricopeptide repeat protein [Fluviicoccus keumensis]|uniref:Tetratricopeptide repeat protein n=1 Tax=Fluviicoccus keumensis TaxID=1435465 RepID=A0A4Q7ZBR4_9GAMM|nr:tetratricopeptide repeat protein [Fluviicoccus keumensis]RZU47385.1 tetratricopeptide repeat protein [Fluviicoccus keumensis]